MFTISMYLKLFQIFYSLLVKLHISKKDQTFEDGLNILKVFRYLKGNEKITV